jgi:hypothetical protein
MRVPDALHAAPLADGRGGVGGGMYMLRSALAGATARGPGGGPGHSRWAQARHWRRRVAVAGADGRRLRATGRALLALLDFATAAGPSGRPRARGQRQRGRGVRRMGQAADAQQLLWQLCGVC